MYPVLDKMSSLSCQGLCGVQRAMSEPCFEYLLCWCNCVHDLCVMNVCNHCYNILTPGPAGWFYVIMKNRWAQTNQSLAECFSCVCRMYSNVVICPCLMLWLNDSSVHRWWHLKPKSHLKDEPQSSYFALGPTGQFGARNCSGCNRGEGRPRGRHPKLDSDYFRTWCFRWKVPIDN